MGRISLCKCSSDVVDIDHGIVEALPRMRVEGPMIVTVMVVAGMLLMIVVIMFCLGMFLMLVMIVVVMIRMLFVFVIMLGFGMFLMLFMIVIIMIRMFFVIMVVIVFSLGVFLMLFMIVVVMIRVFFVIVIVVIMLGFGVIIAMVVVVVALFKRNGLDAGRGNDKGSLEVCRLGQALQPAFKLKTVNNQHIRFAHGARVLRSRLVDVRVTIRADQSGQLDMIAADTLHHVAQDGEGCDNILGIVCPSDRWRHQGESDKSGRGPQDGSAGLHEISFQFCKGRRGSTCAMRPPAGPSTRDTA